MVFLSFALFAAIAVNIENDVADLLSRSDPLYPPPF